MQATGAIDTDMQEIQGLLERRDPYLRFRPGLEAAFVDDLRERVLEMVQRGWWVVLLFYLFVGVSTYAQVHMLSAPAYQAGNLQVWWAIFLAEGGVVAGLVLLPRIAFLREHFVAFTSVVTVVAISVITVGASAFPEPYVNQHSSYVVVFILSIAYGIGAFRLRTAALACGSAALVSWLLIRHFGLWLDAGLFQQYMLVSNVVGLMLCYMVEQRDRRMFLQGRLLQLEKDRLDAYAVELGRLSREDGLTGLANRRHFNETFLLEWERARRDGQPLALLFVDVDHFKPFNDSYGHLEGDAVLARIGGVLRSCLHRPADMAARYGGEEFVLLLPATHEAGAVDVARQVHRTIAALAIPHRASRVAPHVTVSIGVATLVPGPGMRSAQLLAAADEASYAAKAAGRDRIMLASAGQPVPVD